ncbi:hypothetical protein R1sor_017640 [Riccia sorocarpa]|uniref:Uncharacterized protein n=1 Tax=Riccia sorocarpa TaxID=122646 RepID=A0ABD3I7G4_9MARC
MPPSQYADMEDSWEITGVPAMRALKKEYLQELSDGLSRKTVGAIRGLKSARQALCDLNSALCIRLRPWDGIFLEYFAPTILGLPWVADILRKLLEKKFVSVWVTGHVTLEALKCKDTYRTDEQFEILSPFFSQAQVWRCEHAGSSSADPTEADADHECADPLEFPKDATSTWLALKL